MENTNLNWYLAETGDTEDSLVGVGEAWQVEENCILVEVVWSVRQSESG